MRYLIGLVFIALIVAGALDARVALKKVRCRNSELAKYAHREAITSKVAGYCRLTFANNEERRVSCLYQVAVLNYKYELDIDKQLKEEGCSE